MELFLVVIILIGACFYLTRNKTATDNNIEVVDSGEVFKPGGMMSNIKITVKNGYLEYRGAYGDKAIVPVKQITAVSLSPNGFGKSDLIITGSGSELARISKIPSKWAEKSMYWINSKIDQSDCK